MAIDAELAMAAGAELTGAVCVAPMAARAELARDSAALAMAARTELARALDTGADLTRVVCAGDELARAACVGGRARHDRGRAPHGHGELDVGGHGETKNE